MQKTLIMHACVINVFLLPVSKRTFIMHACIINVLLLATRQVKNFGCGSSSSFLLKRNDSVQLPGRPAKEKINGKN